MNGEKESYSILFIWGLLSRIVDFVWLIKHELSKPLVGSAALLHVVPNDPNAYQFDDDGHCHNDCEGNSLIHSLLKRACEMTSKW